jgi:hypothetical protein
VDDELEDEGLVPDEGDIIARPWSWFWLLESFITFVAVCFRNFGNFLDEGFGVQFARMHNRKLEKDDQRDVAEDVLATIHQLPTKE